MRATPILAPPMQRRELFSLGLSQFQVIVPVSGLAQIALLRNIEHEVFAISVASRC